MGKAGRSGQTAAKSEHAKAYEKEEVDQQERVFDANSTPTKLHSVGRRSKPQQINTGQKKMRRPLEAQAGGSSESRLPMTYEKDGG